MSMKADARPKFHKQIYKLVIYKMIVGASNDLITISIQYLNFIISFGLPSISIEKSELLLKYLRDIFQLLRIELAYKLFLSTTMAPVRHYSL